jgi:hypothetical protein
VVAAQEHVEIEHVALEAESESAAERGQRLKGRRADAVVVKRNLVVAVEVQRVVDAPDVGSEELGALLPVPSESTTRFRGLNAT